MVEKYSSRSHSSHPILRPARPPPRNPKHIRTQFSQFHIPDLIPAYAEFWAKHNTYKEHKHWCSRWNIPLYIDSTPPSSDSIMYPFTYISQFVYEVRVNVWLRWAELYIISVEVENILKYYMFCTLDKICFYLESLLILIY